MNQHYLVYGVSQEMEKSAFFGRLAGKVVQPLIGKAVGKIGNSAIKSVGAQLTPAVSDAVAGAGKAMQTGANMDYAASQFQRMANASGVGRKFKSFLRTPEAANMLEHGSTYDGISKIKQLGSIGKPKTLTNGLPNMHPDTAPQFATSEAWSEYAKKNLPTTQKGWGRKLTREAEFAEQHGLPANRLPYHQEQRIARGGRDMGPQDEAVWANQTRQEALDTAPEFARHRARQGAPGWESRFARPDVGGVSPQMEQRIQNMRKYNNADIDAREAAYQLARKEKALAAWEAEQKAMESAGHSAADQARVDYWRHMHGGN